LQLLWRAHYCATRKSLDIRTQLDEPDACASTGDPLFVHKILDLLFSFWYEFFVHCALKVEEMVNIIWMGDIWKIVFFGRGDLTNSFSTLSLLSGP
jgi:hypothetical protein